MSANTAPTPQATKAVTRPRTSDVITPVGFMPGTIDSDVIPMIINLNLGFWIFNLAATCKSWRKALRPIHDANFERIRTFVCQLTANPEARIMNDFARLPLGHGLSSVRNGNHNTCLYMLWHTGLEWTDTLYKGLHDTIITTVSHYVVDWDCAEHGAAFLTAMTNLDFNTLYPSVIPPGFDEHLVNRMTTLLGDAVMCANHKIVEVMLKVDDGRRLCDPYFVWNSCGPDGSSDEKVCAYTLAIRAREVTRAAIMADPNWPVGWDYKALEYHNNVLGTLVRAGCCNVWYESVAASALDLYVDARKDNMDDAYGDIVKKVVEAAGDIMQWSWKVTPADVGMGDEEAGVTIRESFLCSMVKHLIGKYVAKGKLVI